MTQISSDFTFEVLLNEYFLFFIEQRQRTLDNSVHEERLFLLAAWKRACPSVQTEGWADNFSFPSLL